MGKGLVDLRSDTVTLPTPAMRKAMAEAEVGDDGYGEDPTVNELEALFADRVGKPSAVLVPSGTMANQIAVRVLAPPGTSVVVGRHQHIVAYEAGAAARNAAVQFDTVADENGMISPIDVARAIEATIYHQPEVSLVCVENTHMASGGVPWSMAALTGMAAAADGRPVHMDGARLFNAEVATGAAAATMAATATTVMACLSKGLCAPFGSLLAGPTEVIDTCRLERKRLGGAMRQAGIVAAAGLVGLLHMVERLAEDHDRANRLAQVVAERWPEAGCDPDRVRTNIVTFRPPTPERLIDHLEAEGVLAQMINPGVVRLVTHHGVDDAGVDAARPELSGRHLDRPGRRWTETARAPPCTDGVVRLLTLMGVHAHPDDEALFTGGIFARSAAEGIRTVLVTCTGGELGFGPDGTLPGAPGRDEGAVRALRQRELETSCRILGIDHLELLGYHDSGTAGGTRYGGPDAFCETTVGDAARRLAEVVARYRPDAVVTYAADGFYGHPDHVQAHRVAMAALGGPGAPTAPRVFFVAMAGTALAEMIALGAGRGWALPEWVGGALALGGGEAVTPHFDAVIDCRRVVDKKFAAVAAHASQLDNATWVDMGLGAFARIFGTEAYVRAGEPAGPGPGAAPAADDLFAGLR